MQEDRVRSKVLEILDNLPDAKLRKTLDFLNMLQQLPEDQLDIFEEYFDNLGWYLLASEVAEQDWE